jgi:hypothetical protein
MTSFPGAGRKSSSAAEERAESGEGARKERGEDWTSLPFFSFMLTCPGWGKGTGISPALRIEDPDYPDCTTTSQYPQSVRAFEVSYNALPAAVSALCKDNVL